MATSKQKKTSGTPAPAAAQAVSPEMNPMVWPWLFPLLSAIIGFLLYANTFMHDYVLDDAVAVLNNQFVQKGFAGIGDILKVDFWHFSNLTLGYYRPLSVITFAIEHEFFGNNPHVSHVVNVLLYSATALVLSLFLQRLFRNLHPFIPFAIALLFICHPVHTEVVANIKSRDELMSFLGVVGVLFLMLKYDETNQKSFLYAGLIVFYLALLSKETAIPVMLLLPGCFYFFRQKSIMQSIVKTLPLAGILVLFYIQKHAVIGEVPDFSFDELNNYPYTEAKFTSSMSIFFHCVKVLLFPLRLVYDYSYNAIPAGSWSDPVTLGGVALFAGLLFLAIREIRKKSIWGFALGIFFSTFLPAIAFVWLRGGIMAERFLYASSLGFGIALVFAFIHGLKIRSEVADGMKKWVPDYRFAVLIFVIAAAFSFKTIDRNNAWKNNVQLFFTDIKHNPNSAQNNRHCGHELLEIALKETKDTTMRYRKFQEAMVYLRRAVDINPRFGEAWGDLGRGYTNIRFIPDSCIYFYKVAIKNNPGSAINFSNLGVVYEILGRNELASYYYNTASMINPTFRDSRMKAEALQKRTGVNVTVYPGGEDPRFNALNTQGPQPTLQLNR
ncbi:MAG TPA: hypothetical protein PLP34_01405 [Chitinophagaceae bacterium]|nr:hypothetical protein [Chitinophagaceae bacterium]HNF71034.1 hypothetical protein [Chitinophagaceae bacterium]